MSKLDEIKAELLALEAGTTINVHESRIADAIQEARRPMHYYPSAWTLFTLWCGDNGIQVAHMPLSDCFLFEKMAAGRIDTQEGIDNRATQ